MPDTSRNNLHERFPGLPPSPGQQNPCRKVRPSNSSVNNRFVTANSIKLSSCAPLLITSSMCVLCVARTHIPLRDSMDPKIASANFAVRGRAAQIQHEKFHNNLRNDQITALIARWRALHCVWSDYWENGVATRSGIGFSSVPANILKLKGFLIGLPETWQIF